MLSYHPNWVIVSAFLFSLLEGFVLFVTDKPIEEN